MGSKMPLVGPSLAIFIVSIVMMVLSIVAVSLRTFVRLYIVRAFGWDDALMLAALALFVILNACSFIGAMNGAGRTSAAFKNHEVYRTALLYWWLCQIFYTWASALAKVSIAVALLRLTVKRIHRIIIWGTIGLTLAVSFMFWLVLLLDCHPISYFWDYADPSKSGSCMSANNLVKVAYVYSCLTIICDLTLGLLPIFLVWKLQMNYRTKIAVGGILSMGAIASVAVIIRIPFLHFYADTNFLHSTYQIAIWSVVETGLGITASSLFTLRPLFRWLLDEKLSYGRNTRSQGRDYNKYALSSFNNDGLRVGNNSGNRSCNDGKVVNQVTIPPLRDFMTGNSSEEALYPEPNPITSGNYVTVSRTFVQTISERTK
ncbi:uncharacterized protein N7496_012611 [Penicillium cataractarum]|uniref:Rhodopsin domain-containing protein n=1 Tax=Penicillium cataractarum TaxID=2100454 RepID=A0A9W9RAU2_9EURO|nr:uncharacterized protein N7496_012611 [Penicillium cataractarum]KAJ5355399.1 hypothetical protein N7496_012611 [Penicillium cataractarum]